MVNSERLRISITRDAGAIVVAFVGDLDVFVAGDARSHLDEAMSRAVAHSVERVVIDASGLGFCDSTGLSVLVRAHDDAEGRGLNLVLRDLSEPLRELLRLTGLDALLYRDA
jgi:anti-sigma B factor antagonist